MKRDGSLFDKKVRALTDQGVPKEIAMRQVLEEVGTLLEPPQTFGRIKGKILKGLMNGSLQVEIKD